MCVSYCVIISHSLEHVVKQRYVQDFRFPAFETNRAICLPILNATQIKMSRLDVGRFDRHLARLVVPRVPYASKHFTHHRRYNRSTFVDFDKLKISFSYSEPRRPDTARLPVWPPYWPVACLRCQWTQWWPRSPCSRTAESWPQPWKWRVANKFFYSYILWPSIKPCIIVIYILYRDDLTNYFSFTNLNSSNTFGPGKVWSFLLLSQIVVSRGLLDVGPW